MTKVSDSQLWLKHLLKAFFSSHYLQRQFRSFSVSFLLIRGSSFIKSAIQRKTVVRKAKSGYIVHCPVPP